MLSFRRRVVAALLTKVEPERRSAAEAYVEGALGAMPEHLKIGVTADSVLLSVWARAKHPFDLTDEALLELVEGWETSSPRPRAPVRPPARVVGDLRPERVPRGRGRMSTLSTEVLIIGSGAGGAVSAALLAEAGRKVTVVEEGAWLDPDDCEPFSLEELVTKYRNQGLVGRAGHPRRGLRRGSLRGWGHRDQQWPVPPAPQRPLPGVGAPLPDRRLRHRHARPLRHRGRGLPRGAHGSPARRPRPRPSSRTAPPSSAGGPPSSSGRSATSRPAVP